MHHPFTAPFPEDLHDLKTAHAQAYDIIFNGFEVGGGSLRIYQPDVQQQVFETIGLSTESAHEEFGFLLEAFEYGAPPHGSIAYGVDRLVVLLAGEDSIHDVISLIGMVPASQHISNLIEKLRLRIHNIYHYGFPVCAKYYIKTTVVDSGNIRKFSG